MSKKTLLELAQGLPQSIARAQRTNEDLELAVAAVTGLVTMTQARTAYGRSKDQVAAVGYRMFITLRDAVCDGRIVITRSEKGTS